MDKNWEKKINELKTRREKINEAGGEDKIAKQHSSGKLTARERLEALFDDGTFVEVDEMVLSRSTDFGMEKKRKPGDGVVTGYGEIFGRTVFASSQDFTIGGGSLGEAQAMKICRIKDLAIETKAPLISINDGGGARIEEGIDGLSGYADIFYRNTMASGVIPQISVILGPCAGGACYSPAICDYIFMTEDTSQMYITGPSVVQSVTGEIITASDLGGAGVHSNLSGVAHFVYTNDLECLTPTSQIIGTQAVLNVLMGRYKTFTKESKALLRGEYGLLPGEVNIDIRKLAIGEDNVITCRPADLLLPELDSIKKDFGEIANNDEDVLSCALFPKVAPDFIRRRDDLIVHEIDVDWLH